MLGQDSHATIWTSLLLTLLVGASASAETIELKSGDKLEDVQIIERTQDRVVAQHPVLGRIEIPTIEIKPEEEPVEKPGLFGTRFMRGWDRSASLGFAGSSGVTEELNLSADLEASFQSDENRSLFVSRYYLAKTRQDVDKQDTQGNPTTGTELNNTNNEVETRYLHDFLLSESKWFLFASGGHKYDEFQDWKHRLVVAAGFGYDFLRNDDWTVSARFGPGYTRKTKGEDKDEANAATAFNATWRIEDGNSVTFITSYFPILNDTPEFRSMTRLEWKIATGMIAGLSFKLGGSYEYISTNDGNNNDRKYYGNIVYDF